MHAGGQRDKDRAQRRVIDVRIARKAPNRGVRQRVRDAVRRTRAKVAKHVRIDVTRAEDAGLGRGIISGRGRR